MHINNIEAKKRGDNYEVLSIIIRIIEQSSLLTWGVTDLDSFPVE